ncbi:hypothetical protein GCM10010298_69000 [Streptomyces microflavus]|nr:hypothetical protein GCM10010298_69000 [Streptomyces microflavus]
MAAQPAFAGDPPVRTLRGAPPIRPANPPLPEEHARRRGGHGILATHQRTDLRIVAASPTVTRLFDVIGAVTFLHIHPTVEAAHAP